MFCHLKAYCRVNEEFANATLRTLRQVLAELDAGGKSTTTPIIWIHDYHLFTVASIVREVSSHSYHRSLVERSDKHMV